MAEYLTPEEIAEKLILEAREDEFPEEEMGPEEYEEPEEEAAPDEDVSGIADKIDDEDMDMEDEEYDDEAEYEGAEPHFEPSSRVPRYGGPTLRGDRRPTRQQRGMPESPKRAGRTDRKGRTCDP